MSLKGAREFRKQIKRLIREAPRAVAQALYLEGLRTMARAQYYCPVDTGRLRNSGFVAPATDLEAPEVVLGFGTEYAIYVHERDELKHAPPTRAGFLQQAVNEGKEGFENRIAKEVDRLIESEKQTLAREKRYAKLASRKRGSKGRFE